MRSDVAVQCQTPLFDAADGAPPARGKHCYAPPFEHAQIGEMFLRLFIERDLDDPDFLPQGRKNKRHFSPTVRPRPLAVRNGELTSINSVRHC